MTDVSSQPSALEEIRRGIVNVAVPQNEPPGVVLRRRIVVAIVLVLGVASLGLALRRHPGEPAFYWWSLALAGVGVVGGLIAREIPVVAELITRLLRYTDQGSWRLTMAVALLAAVGEELFYRGALYTALARHHPLLISTVIYAIAPLASSRNPMLAFAAIILGTVCGLERRATGGVLAPILTPFVWTLVVLLALPPLFGL